MLRKGTKLYSILKGSCPNCHGESMYVNKNPYLLHKVFDMNERCSLCRVKYKIEPSFFYGAMYVGYGLGVAIAIAIFLLCFLFDFPLHLIFVFITLGLVGLMPIIMRLARNIWINFFIHYGSKP